MAKSAKAFGDDILQIGLACVDDVVYRFSVAEMGRVWFIRAACGGPDNARVRRIGPLAIMEVLAEQSKLPQLISNVLANVCHGTIRSHDNLGLILWRGCGPSSGGVVTKVPFFLHLLGVLPPRHDPAACILSGSRKLNGATGFKLFERRFPKV